MTATATLSRNFSTEDSSAIAFVSIENAPQVNIAFQSNPEKVYTYSAAESVIEEFESFLNDSDVQGLGSFVAAARRSGGLQEV